MWTDFFSQIYLINLSHRTDRLLTSVQQLCDYQIPFKRVEAIHNPQQGAEGLRDTMLKIFYEAIEKDYDNILVFEDDVLFVAEKIWVDDTMEKVVKQLPENYHLCFLGGQPTAGFQNFYSTNLLPVIKFFSTHAVAYSKQGIKEIMARGLGFPIDNWLVSEIEVMGHSYCTYPLLASQNAGYSDIAHQEFSWRPFIEQKFQQKINELHSKW